MLVIKRLAKFVFLKMRSNQKSRHGEMDIKGGLYVDLFSNEN